MKLATWLVVLVGLFLMGFSSSSTPRSWKGKVVGPRLEGWVSCLAVSPDRKLLAAAWAKDNDSAKRGEVYLISGLQWSVSKEVLTSREGWVDDLQFGPNGSVLYAAMSGRSDSLFEYGVSGRSLLEHESVLDGRERRIALNPAAQAKSDPVLVLVGQDGTVWIRNGAGQEVGRVEMGEFGFSGPLVELAFAPDGTYLAVAGCDCGIILERIPDGRALQWHVHKIELPAAASAVAVSDHGRIAFGTTEGAIVVVEAKREAGKRAFEKAAEFACRQPGSVELAWLSDGETLVAAESTSLEVFAGLAPTGKALLAEMFAPEGELFTDVVAGPNCTFFTGATDGQIRQWTPKH